MHYRNAQTPSSTQSSEHPPPSPPSLQLETISATLNEMIAETKELHMKKLEIKKEHKEDQKEFKKKLENNMEIKGAMGKVNVQ